MTIPLVIAGICLSTLHQSSLGSLFLIQPYRTHPLWYSPIIPVLYFLSAVGLGLTMVTLESLLSGWLFGHKIRADLLAGLGRMASFVLALYVVVRLGDLAYRGLLTRDIVVSWQGGLFILELLVSAIIPATLLAIRRVRESIAGLATCSVMTVLGIIGYRFDTCIIAFARPTNMPYFPTWTEMAISIGIVSGAALVFIFFNENLKIVPGHGHDEGATEPQPVIVNELEEPAFADAFIFNADRRRYFLGFIVAGRWRSACCRGMQSSGPSPSGCPLSPAGRSRPWQ